MLDAIGSGIALFFLWLFAVAGIRKLRSPAYYLKLVAAYIPGDWTARAALGLVAVAELLVALVMLVPGLMQAGLLGSAILLTLYAASMAWQYARGRGDLQCGCAGPDSSLRVGPALIARNLICALVALGASLLASTFSTQWGDMILALVLATIMISLYMYSDDLIASAQAMDADV